MGQLRRGVVAAMAAALGSGVIGPATAVADEADSSKYVPLNSILRRCDHSDVHYVPSATAGTGYTIITNTGSTVSAEVHVAGFAPDIWYGVRLVQTPRSGIGCGPGDPGVAMGRIYTDFAGVGTTTVQGPVMEGAEGAWVQVEGPVGNSPLFSGDYRSSDYIATF